MSERRHDDSQRDSSSASGPWRDLPTERRHPASLEFDLLSSEAAVTLLLDEDRRGLELALGAAPAIAQAADWCAETLATGGDLVLAGAGTSGRLAVLEAAECPPTFGTAPERIRALLAGGPEAVFRALEGAEDRDEDGRAAGAALRPIDLALAISASSVTPFARGVLAGARDAGARAVLLTCASGAGMEGLADLVVALDTGAEILTGSTRLKAGSATKAALNAITTVAMVRLGKVYQNWMVDLRPGSAKLRDRALRIVAAACEVGTGEAARALEEAGGEVKAAIVALRASVSVGQARELLAAARGNVRAALSLGEP